MIVRGVFGPLVGAFGHPTVSGLENLHGLEPPFIVAANHSSHMDTPALLLALPPRLRRRTLVVAAADYFYKNRLVGGLVSLSLGTVPLDRKRGGAESIGTIEQLLAEGWAVLAFPEGSRTRDGRLHRGKTGIARLATSARVPVLPVKRWSASGTSPEWQGRAQQGIRDGQSGRAEADYTRHVVSPRLRHKAIHGDSDHDAVRAGVRGRIRQRLAQAVPRPRHACQAGSRRGRPFRGTTGLATRAFAVLGPAGPPDLARPVSSIPAFI